jgi:hypothetical protein
MEAVPLQFNGKDIVLVVGSDVHRAEIIANREDYAVFHGIGSQTVKLMLGYDFMWANLSEYRLNDAHAVWSKISALDAFQSYPDAKWIFWLDFDVIIMRPTIDLGEYILNPDIMFSKLLKDGKVSSLLRIWDKSK